MEEKNNEHYKLCRVVLLQEEKCDDSQRHGNQRHSHTHIADDLQGECRVERSCTQQYGKVSEVITFTHCRGDIGESFILRAASI